MHFLPQPLFCVTMHMSTYVCVSVCAVMCGGF